ncbi:MAG: endo-1,4-beta-xylanase [Halioglobus sp.]|nr:endo-1,4-beta-xylanase [Halioglobus sp.]
MQRRNLLNALSACACLLLAGCLSDRNDRGIPGSPPVGFAQVEASLGPAALPDLPAGRPADLGLLEPAEREVVAAADARAAGLRSAPLQLWIDHDTEITVTQVRHGFTFGFPLELKRFRNLPEDDLQWFGARMAEHFSLAVLESDAKWARVEPAPGERRFEASDENVQWAEDNGFDVKGHTLLWGIPMPLSSAALPKWAEEMFPSTSLTPQQREELRAILKSFIQDSVRHHRGRLDYWDVTNETLQQLAQWFIDRLGPGIVNDAFHWAREADPDVALVFNEWIVEVFTGFNSPTAADVRDRVLQLLSEGVPIDALGQQAHFAPTVAFVDPGFDISGRTPIDEYAQALDILAETGLPIHLTETNFISPPEPELRAAQAEALMRLWWGHPAVEMIVFWGPWNKVAGRDEFDVGFWDDERNITRHGEAVFSLLNDRWRTRATLSPDTEGLASVRATYGDYVASWQVGGVEYHARFSVSRDPATQRVALVTP